MTSRSPLDEFSPRADSGPQVPRCLGNGRPSRQAQALQRLPDTGQNPWLWVLLQVLLGNVVDSPQLLAVVVAEVTELLHSSLGDDGDLGGEGDQRWPLVVGGGDCRGRRRLIPAGSPPSLRGR